MRANECIQAIRSTYVERVREGDKTRIISRLKRERNGDNHIADRFPSFWPVMDGPIWNKKKNQPCMYVCIWILDERCERDLFFSEQCSLFKTSLLTVTEFRTRIFYFCSPGIKGYASHPTVEHTRGRHPVSRDNMLSV